MHEPTYHVGQQFLDKRTGEIANLTRTWQEGNLVWFETDTRERITPAWITQRLLKRIWTPTEQAAQ
jgi:hypothetical protein